MRIKIAYSSGSTFDDSTISEYYTRTSTKYQYHYLHEWETSGWGTVANGLCYCSEFTKVIMVF